VRPHDHVLRNQSVGSRWSGADQEIVRRGLRVLDEDVEVPVLVEDAGVDELELSVELSAAAVFLHQAHVGIFGLRVFVQRAHPRVSRRGVEVVVTLFHVLAVVAFRPGEAEEALLQDRIASVPEGEREAQPSFAVRDSQEAVLSPPIRATARVVVREVVPAAAVGGVVFPHRAPLPLGEIGTPALPVLLAPRVLGEAFSLGARRFFRA
jgi:hypothetical protein